jgi:uncharacterized protein YqjF (DUF2071 family)
MGDAPRASVPFLTAHWANVVNFTWRVDPALLARHVPDGVTLDVRDGAAFASLVAFEFRDTRVRGLRIPLHVDFPEINLRFYVRYGGRRGVVFLRELVPRACIALVARRLYNEPYRRIAMQVETRDGGEWLSVEHRFGARLQSRLSIRAGVATRVPDDGSEEHYFKEHELGFGRTRSGETIYYRVQHPVWAIGSIIDYRLEVDFAALYGREWAALDGRKPDLVMLARGSAIEVMPPRPLSQLAVEEQARVDCVRGRG